MTLNEILPKVLRMLGDIGCDHVSIARDSPLQDHPDQIRFDPDQAIGYHVMYRRWIQTTTSSGDRMRERVSDVRATFGWSKWLPFVGFTVECVLATDWDIIIT